MKRFTAIALAALMVLTVLASVIPASAATTVDSIEIRSAVFNDTANGGSNQEMTTSNFAGFFYDFKTNAGTENLTLLAGATSTGRTVDVAKLVYSTSSFGVNFKSVNLRSVDNDASGAVNPTYMKIGYLSEEYVPIKATKVDKLSKLLMDEKDTVSHTVRAGQSLELGEGYTLTPQQIDVNGDKVWLELSKNGEFVKDEVISVANATAYTDKTFIYKKDIGGETDVVMLLVHIDQVFQGQVDSLCVIKGVWQISDTIKTIASDEEVGKLKGGPSGTTITMDNENTFDLTRNSDVVITPELSFRVADTADTDVRFYLFKTITAPGTYEIRGTAMTVDASNDTFAYTANATWTANNFPGFYYELKTDANYETLMMNSTEITGGANADDTQNRTIAANSLVYTATIASGNFKSVNLRSVDNNASGAVNPTYPKIGYLAEEYVPIKATKADKLSKLLMDEKDTVSHTVRAGQSLELGEGYALTPQQIDVNGDKVWLELTKNGEFVKDEVISVANASAYTDKTFIYKKDIGGETDVVMLLVHIDQVFQGQVDSLAVIKGVWQISDTITTIASDETVGKLKGGPSGTSIIMKNENEFTLTRNSDVAIAAGISLKVADDATLTRVYPFIEMTITGEVVEEEPVEVPVEEPVDEVPVDEVPVDEVPVDEVPVDEVPVDVEEAPVEEAPVEEPPEEEPGFEAIFAIAGLLAVAFLVRRNK